MKWIFSIFFGGFWACLSAQSYIDQQQDRIDALDGKVDKFLSLRDLDLRNSATYTYMTLIDELQKNILESDHIINENKIILYKEMNKELFEISTDELLTVTNDEMRYTFLLDWVKAYGNQDMLKLMKGKPTETFMCLNFIYPFEETQVFLDELPTNYIDQLLFQYDDFRKADYGQEILEKIVLRAPVTAKKYFIRNQPIYNALFMSTDPGVKSILAINERYGQNTRAYVLLDKIVKKEISITQADSIGKSKYYFKNLLEIRANKTPLAELSLDREVEYEALEYVREVNHLHEESNPEVRFAMVKNLTATELYTLIVYGEDEIFTSSYNGVYDRLMQQMKTEKISGYQLFEKVGFNKFRMFIKMLSYYGKLNAFLATMTDEEKETIMRRFVGGIHQTRNRIQEAVSVADAISAINDKKILLILEEEIYAINKIEILDDDARLIYGLLIKMFNPKVQHHVAYFDSISNLYFTPPIEKLEKNSLLGRDGKNVQKHFFYDDDDGKASFNSFKESFKSSNWLITEEKEYIKITATNNKVKIYANKPEFDETAWYYVDKEIKEKFEDVEFIIHRGHSYYVDYTIEQIPNTAKLILLGSCGGYNKLTSLLEASNFAHIISTKQIGTMGVNNPLIFKMAEKIRKGEDLVWQTYWQELNTYFKDKETSKEKFSDYVPPHQNLGAKYIAAYKTYSWVGGLKN